MLLLFFILHTISQVRSIVYFRQRASLTGIQVFMKNQTRWILLIPFLISSRSWIHLCFACYTNEDCTNSYCCEIDSDDYRCMSTPCDYDFCISDNDCRHDADRCDQSQGVCTAYCSLDSECRENHKCEFNNCVYQKKEENSMDAGSVLVIIAIIIGAILFGCCCHFCTNKRREEQLAELRANDTAVPRLVATQSPNDNQTPVYILHLQANNSERNVNADSNSERRSDEAPHEENEPISDTIVESGPPPYSCLTRTDEPQCPPPSYDEALRTSTENLTTTREQQHFV